MPDAPSAPPAAPGKRVWRKFLKSRGGKAGLAMIAAFMLVALFAPFLAHRLPFYWRDAATGETSYPLLREFFAPSDTTETFLETGINFLLLYLPLAFLAWRLMGRFVPRFVKGESRAVSLLFGVLCSVALWFGLGGMIVQVGGSDWLRRETPPTPEVEDLESMDAFASPAPAKDETVRRAREIVAAGIAGAGGEAGAKFPGDAPDGKRAFVMAVQSVIDGPALAGVAEMTSSGAIDARGLTDASLTSGSNTARWNRIILDHAYPGLFPPFVRYRTAFLVAAACTLLVLAGMTFIFLAGAVQFAASPAWLALLALAVAVGLPFAGRPRNDPTPYRQLMAEGRGYGIFPPIPYGPNEQGFGPRLPPGWRSPPASLAPGDIASPDRLRALLDNPGTPAARHIRDVLLRLGGRAGGRALPDDDGEALALLNRALADDGFHDADAFSAVRGDVSLLPYLTAVRGGTALSAADRLRMNRLLLERALPASIESAPAGRWKKPPHLAGTHLLGTDESGRDVLVRIIHGARVSLSVGFVSVALATLIGVALGSLAAYYGGWADMAISRFMELMMCFPSFFLILAVIAVLDRRSILNIMLIIGLTSWTGVARLIRGEVLKHKKMEYVSAAIALGASDARTIFRHILPNAMAPVLVSISFGITGAILTEAGLSFIGFGVTPPTPTWGQLLGETRESPLANWWLAVFPGLVLFLGVFAYNLVGEALRDALDPRTSM